MGGNETENASPLMTYEHHNAGNIDTNSSQNNYSPRRALDIKKLKTFMKKNPPPKGNQTYLDEEDTLDECGPPMAATFNDALPSNFIHRPKYS